MTKILGPEWFPRTQAERNRLYRDHISGSTHTNWSLMTNAARSNLISSAKACANVLNLWGRVQSKAQRPAETELILQIDYARFAIGPLIGTVLSSAIALESFMRLYAEIAIGRDGHTRKATVDGLRNFDALPMKVKFDRIQRMAGLPAMPVDLQKGLEALVNFRNDCVHDSPITFRRDGAVTRVRHGKANPHRPDQRYAGYFPALHEHQMPLTPRHAVLAADLHDEFCWGVLEQGNSKVAEGIRGLSSRALFRIVGFGLPRDQIDNIVGIWEARLLPWLEGIDMEEREDFYRDVTRKFVVKPVDDARDAP